MSTASRLVAFRSSPVERTTAVAAVGALIAVELATVVVYLESTGTALLTPRYTIYPFVWINLAAEILLRRPNVSATGRRRAMVLALAGGYFLVLAIAGGIVRLGGMSMPLRVVWLSPGWGPAVLYGGQLVHLSVLPFEVVGYIALAVLVYRVVLAGARTALAGLLGVATCVGCLWPIGAATVAALRGVGSPLATTVPGFAYDLSTVMFVVTASVLHFAARRTT